MLVLSRRKDESVMIGDSLEVKVLDIQKGQVKLGIEAPRDVTVHRREVYLAIQQENLAATQAADSDMSALADLFKETGLADKAEPAEARPRSRGVPRTRPRKGPKKA